MTDQSPSSGRSVWWWIFFMPGSVMLWFEYMFPRSISGSMGSARRRKSQLVQLWYTLGLYAVVIFFGYEILFSQPH